MDYDDGILASLDDLVEVANRTATHGARERAVTPLRLPATHHITAQ